MRVVLIALGLVALTISPLAAQDTRYVCTEFIGYSQAWNTSFGAWGPYAAQTMVAGGVDRVQSRWQNAGAAFRWAGLSYDGWNAVGSNPAIALPSHPCATQPPDRLILDITHNEYLTAVRFGDPVAFMETTIRNFVATAKARKPSAANNIVLQPVIGGPGHALTCPIATAPELGVVRASFNHPVIWAAILRVASDTLGVTVGYDPHVRTCADYADWEGHLVGSASQPIGQTIGTYYRDLWMQVSTPTPLPTSTPTLIPTVQNTPVPSPTPPARCYDLVQVDWDGTWRPVREVVCP